MHAPRGRGRAAGRPPRDRRGTGSTARPEPEPEPEPRRGQEEAALARVELPGEPKATYRAPRPSGGLRLSFL